MDQGSMDHVHGPGPRTPCHGPGPWTVFLYFYKNKVLHQVHTPYSQMADTREKTGA